jgi:hypothetical protein
MAEEKRNRRYIAKDFDQFRSLLLDYARTYYPDKIADFSETSMGGVFLDFASYVGDILSYYMDHQFTELNPDLAVESKNIENLIKNSGIKITGATPAYVKCRLSIRIPIQSDDSVYPIIKEGTIVSARNGITFRLLEDIDFSNSTDRTIINSPNLLNSLIVSKTGNFLSGIETTEEISIGDFESFKRIKLKNPNVTKIFFVSDSNGNDFYEVNSLVEEIVYKNLKLKDASNEVRDILKIIPAPYRYITETDINERSTFLTFGGGSASNFEDDVIPDPSDFALTLYGTSTFSRSLINPSYFVNRRTFGVVDENTTITVRYMYGGGLSHNVPINEIDTVTLLKIVFPGNPNPRTLNSIRNSVQVTNPTPSVGGAEALTIEEYKSLINQTKNSQMRIVTKEDLLARIYSMPSNFGRVFRAAIIKDQKNSLITKLYIICKNFTENLVKAPTYLKNNLINNLDSYRMLSDVIEIFDSEIINFSISCTITVDPIYKKESVIEKVKNNILNTLNVNKIEIDQPINASEIRNIIYNTPGVITITNIEFLNRSGIIDNREYVGIYHDMEINRVNDFIYPPVGGIFELRFKKNDINIYAN